MSYLPFAIAAWLFVVGLYGIVSSRNLISAILSLTVVQSATYLVLLGVGYVNNAKAAIFYDIPQVAKTVDPVVQVLVLTDIVIEATVTGSAASTRTNLARCATSRRCTSPRFRSQSR
jgi:multicomponent Na+:H+ antiporter subunit C